MKKSWIAILLLCLLPAACKNDSTTGNAQLPAITGMTPPVVNPGQSNVEGHILGNNLLGVVSVDLGEGVTVHQTSSMNPSDVYVFFSVSRDTFPGQREIRIQTSAGLARSTSAFQIGQNRLPIAKFAVSPPSGILATVFRFDGSASSDPDGSISSYQWHFEDGASASGKVVTHKFRIDGTLKAELTVTDDRGASERFSKFIDIDASKPPLAQFSVSPSTGNTNTLFTFDGSASRDPDGKISDYQWAFGDGSTASGRTVQHRFAAVSSFNVLLAVKDNSGMTSSSNRDVLVDSAPSPEPSPGPDPNPNPDPGPDPTICTGSNVFGQNFSVVSVSGSTLTGNVSFANCPGLCGELRRNAQGLKEFAGWIDSVSGSQLTFNLSGFSSNNAPKTGEQLRAIWLTCGS